MIKFFCDVCTQQIDKPTPFNRVKKKFGHIEVEVQVAVSGVWNGGHVCELCVKEAVTCGGPPDVLSGAQAIGAVTVDTNYVTVDPRFALHNDALNRGIKNERNGE